MPVTHNNGGLPQALGTMKVLDLTQHVAGPFCTKLLADYGAEVIKVERPGQGDPGRRLGPFPEDKPRPDSSGLFSYLNGNKLGITLDLKHAAGVGICKELVRWADVVVESFRPGVMAGYSLSYSQLSKTHPGVIVTSLSSFGQSGPYRDYKASEIIEYAIGGPMLFTGTSDREPLKLGGRVGMIFAGQEAAMATLMAFYREIGGDGDGEHLDVSIMETQAGSIDRQTALLVNYQYTGNRYSRPDASEAYLGGVYPALDGYLDVQVIERFPPAIGCHGPARHHHGVGSRRIGDFPGQVGERGRQSPGERRAYQGAGRDVGKVGPGPTHGPGLGPVPEARDALGVIQPCSGGLR